MNMNALFAHLTTTWSAEIAALLHALELIAPVLAVVLFVWLVAPAGQWLIDRYTARPRRPPVRAADAKQIARDEEQLWRRHRGFEDTYPVDPQR